MISQTVIIIGLVTSAYITSFLENAIPDRFANPGISGLSLLNPGINPGIESSQIMAGYSWSCNRQNSNNKDYKV